MLRKRIFATPQDWKRELNVPDADGKLPDPNQPAGVCLNPPPLSHIALVHTGLSAEQNFHVKEVEQGVAEGWATVNTTQITMKVRLEDGSDELLRYSVKRTPGRWCCHCKSKLADDSRGTQARLHVAQAHAGQPSPDAAWPAGYAMLNHYECVLDSSQHELYKAEAGAQMTPGWLARKLLARKALKAGVAIALMAVSLVMLAFTPTPGDVLLAANIVFNIALGRIVEFYIRIDTNDPANSAFVIVVIDAGATTDATFKDHDALSNVTGASTERSTNGWTRKTLTDVDLSAWAPDDVNDRTDLVIADQTWTAVAGAGGASTDVVITYDSDTTAGTDANIVPCTLHDFAITPDGSDVTLDVPVTGFLRVS